MPQTARDPEFYGEWLDSYYARDVQELFHLGKRSEFLRMLELVLRQSGGMLEITSLAKHTGVSRATVSSWLDILQITHVAFLVRPFAEGGLREILAQPKVYGFDTGFACYARGWEDLRPAGGTRWTPSNASGTRTPSNPGARRRSGTITPTAGTTF